jgi:hypothetical protein
LQRTRSASVIAAAALAAEPSVSRTLNVYGMTIALESAPPMSDLMGVLLVLVFLNAIAGSIWAVLSAVRNRVTVPEQRAWTLGLLTGLVGGVVAMWGGLPEPQFYHLALLGFFLTVTTSFAGLLLMFTRDLERRALGKAVYRSTAIACLGFMWVGFMLVLSEAI